MADIELIKPRELPAITNAQPTDAVMLDNGVTVGKVTPEQLVNAGAAVASEAEALAGVNNTKRMTPLRVRQVLDNVNNPAVLRAQAWAESSTPPDPLLPDSKSAKTWASIAEQGVVMVQWSMIATDGQTVLGDDITTGEPIRAFGGVAQISVNGFGPITPEEYSVDSDGVITLTAPLAEGDVVSGFTQPRLSNSEAQAVVQGVLQQTGADVAAAQAAADRAEVFGWRNKNSLPDLIADTSMTTSNTPIGSGVHVNGVGDYIRVGGAGDVANAAGVQFDVKPAPDGFVSVSAFGSNVDAWQKAFDKYNTVLFSSGATYSFTDSIKISRNMKIRAVGATLEGVGSNSGRDIFEVTSDVSLNVEGGEYSDARWAIGARIAKSITVDRAKFRNCAHAIGANVITNTPFATGELFRVTNCDFDDMEAGVFTSSCIFRNFIVINCTGRNFKGKGLTDRPYPLDKKITAGVWLSTLTISGAANFLIEGNNFNDIQEITPVSIEPEVHGIAVHALDNEDTNVIINGNIVKNVTGASTIEGLEGIMGRGNRVIIDSNILVDAGNLEGFIYAKASTLHKVTNNILEVTSGYAYKSTARGIISDGDNINADISGNKFIGFADAIYSRSSYSKISGNEFLGCSRCMTLAMLATYTHRQTILENNFADASCGTFFSDVTGIELVKGNFVLQGNVFNGSAYFCSGKGGVDYVISENTIKRNPVGTTRELMLFAQDVTRLFIRDNAILGFDTLTGDGRIFSNSLGYVKSVYITGNHMRDGDIALFLNNFTYVDLIVRNNDFFDCSPLFNSGITVTGKNVVTANVGIDL